MRKYIQLKHFSNLNFIGLWAHDQKEPVKRLVPYNLFPIDLYQMFLLHFFISLIIVPLINTQSNSGDDVFNLLKKVKVPIVYDSEIRPTFLTSFFDKVEKKKGELFITGRAARHLAAVDKDESEDKILPLGGFIELAVKHPDLETEREIQNDLKKQLNSARRFLKIEQDNLKDPEMLIQDYLLPKFDVISSLELGEREKQTNAFFKVAYDTIKKKWKNTVRCILLEDLFPKNFTLAQSANHAFDIMEFDLLFQEGKLCSSSVKRSRINREYISLQIKKFSFDSKIHDKVIFNRALQVYSNANSRALTHPKFQSYRDTLSKIIGDISILPKFYGYGLSKKFPKENLPKDGILWYQLDNVETLGLLVKNIFPRVIGSKRGINLYKSHSKCIKNFNMNSGINGTSFYACIPMKLKIDDKALDMNAHDVDDFIEIYGFSVLEKIDYHRLLSIYRALLIPNLQFNYSEFPGSKNIQTRYILYSQIAKSFGTIEAPIASILLETFNTEGMKKQLTLNDLMPIFLDDSSRASNENLMRFLFGNEYFANALFKFARYPTYQNANKLKLEIFNDSGLSGTFEFLDNFKQEKMIYSTASFLSSEDYDEIIGYDHFLLNRMSKTEVFPRVSSATTYRTPISYMSSEEKKPEEKKPEEPKLKEVESESDNKLLWISITLGGLIVIGLCAFLFYWFKIRQT